jgi:tRNA modification GTPase
VPPPGAHSVFSTTDTIVAIATPPGRGGIGVVRLSGSDAHAVARRLVTHEGPLHARHATFTKARLHPPSKAVNDTNAEDGGSPNTSAIEAIDQIVATLFPAPHSYTGEDVVELSAHGSPIVLQTIVNAAIGRGARLAEPGEFTLRAFLNGRIDLPQAEAVHDLIEAVTPLQARAAFDQLDGTLTLAIAAIDAALFDLIARLEASVDFPDEGYHFVDPAALAHSIDDLLERSAALLGDARRGRMIREGLQIAIVGAPNAGKSSLFNSLAGTPRAIVTDVPGTTRDLVTEAVDIEGLRVTLTDTAGLRDTDDPVEVEGVARARQSMIAADLVLLVQDRSQPRKDSGEDLGLSKVLCVANKIDRAAMWSDPDAVPVSALTGAGIAELRRRIVDALDVDPLKDRPAITNVRHVALVERAHGALARARAAADGEGRSLSEEFVLADLADARAALEEVTGRRTSDELLAHIFSRFCIGK